ncbi:MAG: acetylxylan esterase [Roseibacillus sp.]
MFKPLSAALLICGSSLPLFADYESDRAEVAALGNLTSAPAMYEVDTSSTIYQSSETLATLTPSSTEQTLEGFFFDSVDYRGDATRVYALVGMPQWDPATDAPLPAIVLVHGGSGQAYETWANLWAERGYVAIAIDTEGASNTTSRHSKGGPRRTGVFHESEVVIGDQFMFHATAASVGANSLLRSLPFVDETKVGIHGVSWGGLITSTVMGVDTRFAFAIPSYGCGHMWDGIGKWQEAISDAGGTDYYKNVWDAMLWLEDATMPIMWLSWPKENNFNIDCQANSYNQAPGTQMVCLIPGMRHSHAFTWRRADSYDFADSIVGNSSGSTGLGANQPWCVEKSQSLVGDQIVVKFESTRPLTGANLIYTNEMGSTTFMAWPEVSVDGFGETFSGSGIWEVNATLPADANGWFVNVTADSSLLETAYLPGETEYFSETIYVSSRLQERVEVVPPSSLDLVFSTNDPSVRGEVSVDFTAIHNLEVTAVEFVNESHPGAFSTEELFVFGLIAGTPFEVAFDNAVAGLSSGESSTGTLRLTWVALDNVTTETIDIFLSATADDSLVTTFTWDGGGSNNRWTVGENWLGDASPPEPLPVGNFTDVVLADAGNRVVSNLYSNFTVRNLAVDASVDDAFTVNIFRSSSYVRSLTFENDGSPASLSVDAGAEGALLFSDFDTAGSILLHDDLELVHNGTGNLTFDVSIAEQTGEANGVTSSGSGNVIMQGVNTYTGDTIVEAGSLTLEAGSSLSFVPTADEVSNQLSGVSAGTGTVNLAGEIYLDLELAESSLGNRWVLIDDSDLNVVYDAVSFSVNSSEGMFSNNAGIWTLQAGEVAWTFTEETGVLEVMGEPYETWAEGAFVHPFTETEPLADFDGDGLVNYLEFVLGGDPTVFEADIGLSFDVQSDDVVFVFNRSDLSKESAASSVRVEVSEDLAFITPGNDIPISEVSEAGPIGELEASYTVSNGDGFDAVVVTIPRAGLEQIFVRLAVTLPIE